MPMPDFTRRFPLSKTIDAKNPSRLSICIVLQYAKSLRVEKKLPAPLNSFIINWETVLCPFSPPAIRCETKIQIHQKMTKKLFKFVLLFKKNYFSGEFFLVLAIIAGYLSQIKGEECKKETFWRQRFFIYFFRKKFKQFLRLHYRADAEKRP